MYQEDSFKTSQVVYAHTRSDEADMEYKMHCHNSYEIYYMVKGNVEYFLEGTSYDHSAKLLSWAAGAGRKRVPQDPAALCAGTSDGKGKTAAFGNSWKKLGVYGRTVPGRMVF